MENTPAIKQVSFLGNHPPRLCGIATFTSDLCEAIAAEFPQCHCIVGAVNDRPEGYDYPVRVRFEIDQTELASYRRAAEFLNVQKVDVVSIQHEFGISVYCDFGEEMDACGYEARYFAVRFASLVENIIGLNCANPAAGRQE